MGSATVSVMWAPLLLLFLLFYSFSPSHPLLYVNTLQPTSTMGIKTRASTIKGKPPKSAAAAIPLLQSACGSSKSPRAANVNSLLAKINLPKSQFDGILTAFIFPGGRNDGLDGPCDLVLPAMETCLQPNTRSPPQVLRTAPLRLLPRKRRTNVPTPQSSPPSGLMRDLHPLHQVLIRQPPQGIKCQVQSSGMPPPRHRQCLLLPLPSRTPYLRSRPVRASSTDSANSSLR
jgi:hypothetical protein